MNSYLNPVISGPKNLLDASEQVQNALLLNQNHTMVIPLPEILKIKLADIMWKLRGDS